MKWYDWVSEKNLLTIGTEVRSLAEELKIRPEGGEKQVGRWLGKRKASPKTRKPLNN
jgi:hypothetical protein